MVNNRRPVRTNGTGPWNPDKGYNTSLFAYGQTGAGKSYSMVGYGINKERFQIIIGERHYDS